MGDNTSAGIFGTLFVALSRAKPLGPEAVRWLATWAWEKSREYDFCDGQMREYHDGVVDALVDLGLAERETVDDEEQVFYKERKGIDADAMLNYPYKMMPGQGPYTRQELEQFKAMLQDAIDDDPGEQGEVEGKDGASR